MDKLDRRKTESIFEYIIVHYRWVFVCFFLLPISFFYDIWLYFRNWIVFTLTSAPKNHEAKVRHVQSQVQQWIKNGKKTTMCTARPGWQTVSFRRPKYKDTMHKIEVNLVDILEIDPVKGILRVEPLVSMGQLTATINPLDWTIPIVPEIDDLTVGGLVMGTGIESSSHRHGLFQHICTAFELVTSDGQVTRCSAEEHPDLFRSVPWSYGTVGILTAVEIKMIPAKRFVRLEYEAIRSAAEMARRLERVSRSDGDEVVEFVEALMFSEEEGVLMTGNMTNQVEDDKVNRIGRWYKPWFFVHVREMLKQKTNTVEYIPLRDYYHRHTRAIFWELQDIIPFGNHPVFRYLFGWIVPPKISLLKLTQTDAIKRLYENNHVIQDMLVPIGVMKQSISAFHKAFEVYPLWICPFILAQQPGLVHPASKQKTQLYVDIGVYGVPKAKDFKPKESTKAVEHFVIKNHGFQMLYADTYMTREEFRTMFDHSLYDQVRKKWDCKQAFPEIYDKISKNARI